MVNGKWYPTIQPVGAGLCHLSVIISDLTSMNAHSELQLFVRAVSYRECFDGFQHLQSHPGYLPGVFLSIAYWQP